MWPQPYLLEWSATSRRHICWNVSFFCYTSKELTDLEESDGVEIEV